MRIVEEEETDGREDTVVYLTQRYGIKENQEDERRNTEMLEGS